jgi:hypothetical protein
LFVIGNEEFGTEDRDVWRIDNAKMPTGFLLIKSFIETTLHTASSKQGIYKRPNTWSVSDDTNSGNSSLVLKTSGGYHKPHVQ